MVAGWGYGVSPLILVFLQNSAMSLAKAKQFAFSLLALHSILKALDLWAREIVQIILLSFNIQFSFFNFQ